MQSINLTLFYAIRNAAGIYPWLDTFFIVLTKYGISIISVYVAYFLFYSAPKRVPTIGKKFHVYLRGLEVTLSAGMAWFVVYCIKVIVQIPRPFTTLSDVRALITQTGYSFPSGHATVAFAIATAVYIYYRPLGKTLFIFAFLIALSRIYVAVHYPVDVVVGAVLGCGIAVGVHYVGRRKIVTIDAPTKPQI